VALALALAPVAVAEEPPPAAPDTLEEEAPAEPEAPEPPAPEEPTPEAPPPVPPPAEQPTPEAPPSIPPAAEEPAAPEEPVPVPEVGTPPGGVPFALYVGFAVGTGSSDAFDTSIFASELDAGVSQFTIDEQVYGKGAIGWKLQHGKGDLRFIFQGIKEDQYDFQSQGVSVRLPSGQADLDSGLVPWWFVEVNGGQLTSTRLVPMWDTNADATYGDGDGIPDFGTCTDLGNSMTRCGEITYDGSAPDRVVTGTLPDDFQNRIDTYDIVYGREFGGRRYSSHWWAGLRYFQYDGQVLATAWLNAGGGSGTTAAQPGEHFTDGGFLPLLQLAQEASGLGPLGSWEVDFNFFDRAFQLYVRAEAAFTLNSLSLDSQPFFQVVDEGGSGAPAILLPDRLNKDLDKSSWQDRLEAGARLHMKNGLQFEVAVARSGFLDIVLLPNLLQTGVTNEDPQTSTQDVVFDSFHAGVGFQF
jgi:hypothetical protein